MSNDTIRLRERMKAFHEEVTALHMQMAALNADLVQELNKGGPPSSGPDLADIGYLLRECGKVLKEMRIDCDAKAHFTGQILFVSLAQAHLSGKSGELVYRGRYGNAYPRAGKRPITPRRGTEAYRRLLQWLGVPDAITETGVLEPHYVRLTELLNSELSKGNEPPKDLGIEMAPYDTCTYRKKRKSND